MGLALFFNIFRGRLHHFYTERKLDKVFKTKPITVLAFQLTPFFYKDLVEFGSSHRYTPLSDKWPEWFFKLYEEGKVFIDREVPNPALRVTVKTLKRRFVTHSQALNEGHIIAGCNDWIVNYDGNLQVVNEEDFKKMYFLSMESGCKKED